MSTDIFDEDMYLDVHKALQLGGEGGSVTLYRVLPRGEANFVWYAVGSGGFDDEPFTMDDDILGDYEDITDYLNQSVSQLAMYYLEYADPAYREQIFSAFLESIRGMRREPSFLHPLQHVLGDAPAGSWCAWQKSLQLTAPRDRIVIHSGFGESPVLEMAIDYAALRSTQQLLDVVYMGLVGRHAPAGSYGKAWQLYDLISCRQLAFPRDDRGDHLREAGITQGGRWLVHGLE